MSKQGFLIRESNHEFWRKATLWTAAGLATWLIVWIVVSWPYSLDDALIHLRYADHLLRQHRITYDGVHASFGTSSLLYVSLLAALRELTSSPILPRAVSSVVYLGLFLLLVVQVLRVLGSRDQPPALWLGALLLLSIMVAPSAIRWLDDGMETGLVFLDAVVGFVLLRRIALSTKLPPELAIAGAVYGFLSVLLRVELLLLVGCVAVMAGLELYTGRVRRMSVEHPLRVLAVSAMPLAGGLLAALTIRWTMHALLPDTALAKAFGTKAWQDTFVMTATTVASSFSFGVGLLLLWIFSLVALVLWDEPRLVDLPGNALFPIVVLASSMRGQQIQGIRYFGWTLLFPLLWNAFRIASRKTEGALRFERVATALCVVLILAMLPMVLWESKTFSRLFQERGATLNAFRAEPEIGRLQGRFGIAEDVGFIGYFTQGDICDPYGLINGRAAARLTYDERFLHCMAMRPEFAFGSREFLQKVTFRRPLVGWIVCGSYAFDNVRSRDVHYLVVDPEQGARVCPQTGVAVQTALPGLL